MPSRSGEFDLPGVTPSRQKRSRETTAALLQAGAEMLRSHSLAELSIEALCRQVGATVGAFYSRFESKDAYFNALMALAARDGARAAAPDLVGAQVERAERREGCHALRGPAEQEGELGR